MSNASPSINLRGSRFGGLLRNIRSGDAWLWNTTWAMLGIAAMLFTFEFFDPRQLNGINLWDKPAKFFVAFAIQFSTVSWALNYLRVKTRATEIAVYIMVAAGWAENIYIAGRAAFGLTSHFNNSTLFSSIAYAVMGLGAVSMTATAFFIGWQIWRQSPRGLWREAAALGLMAGAILGTLAGGYMSAQASHWVGGVPSDAHGLPVFGWSTSGGDLRVAHFIGLHAAQFIPLAALSGDRRVVYGVSVAIVLLTSVLFILGTNGVPLLRA